MTTRTLRTARILAAAALTMAGAAFLTFTLLFHAPGDRTRIIANARFGGEGSADPAVIAAIQEEFGFDRPFIVQFLDWLHGAVGLDFGTSMISGRSVTDIVGRAYLETVPLAVAAFALGVVTAVGLACAAALRPRSWIDRAVVATASVGSAIPSYLVSIVLILVFAVWLRWLPSYGHGSIAHGILPIATLAIWLVAAKTRLFRSFVLSALAAPHLDVLRVRGVGEASILSRHVLHHVLVGMVPVLCLELAVMVEGAVIVEVVFARPGVGTALLGALQARDHPVVLCIVVTAAAIYTSANVLSDAITRVLDPRWGRREDGVDA